MYTIGADCAQFWGWEGWVGLFGLSGGGGETVDDRAGGLVDLGVGCEAAEAEADGGVGLGGGEAEGAEEVGVFGDAGGGAEPVEAARQWKTVGEARFQGNRIPSWA